MPLPIGFFAPLAVPVMGAYLVWQNANMASAFGLHFKKGERRIGAMPNDAFTEKNRIATEKKLIKMQLDDMKAWTASMPQFFEVARQLIIEVIGEFAKFFGDAAAALAQLVTGQPVSGLTGTSVTSTKGQEFPQIPGLNAPLIPGAEAFSNQSTGPGSIGTLGNYTRVVPERGIIEKSPAVKGEVTKYPNVVPDMDYWNSIDKMSFSTVSRELKNYARAQDTRVPASARFVRFKYYQYPKIGEKLLARFNELKSKPESKPHYIQQQTRNNYPWNQTQNIQVSTGVGNAIRQSEILTLVLQSGYALMRKKYPLEIGRASCRERV